MAVDPDAAALMGLVVEGRYRLEHLLGSGGTGLVFRASDSTGEPPIAIKVLRRRHTAESPAAKRFIREATLAGLRHPNIVQVHAAGLLPNDQPYMTMELLCGESLDARFGRNDPLDIADATRIVVEVLSGLAAAHEAGFVHRDVKPENVFLAGDGDAEVAKLLDFSVARVASESVRVTATGDIIGTPAYLAPEQATGLKDQDARVDVWSTGVLLYRLLTGRTPFLAKSLGELIVKIVSQDPPPPRRHRPDMPDALETVVLRALRREREARFASAAEMAEAVLAAT